MVGSVVGHLPIVDCNITLLKGRQLMQSFLKYLLQSQLHIHDSLFYMHTITYIVPNQVCELCIISILCTSLPEWVELNM